MAEEKQKSEKQEKQKTDKAAPKSAAPGKPAEGKKGDAPVAAAAETGAPPTAASLLAADQAGLAKPKRIKGAKNIINAIAHVFSTYNNTVISITDPAGNVISWSSAGRIGFKGSKKSTAYAAQLVAQDAGRQAMAHGVKECEVHVKGAGSGRESAVRALQAIGIEISTIRDVTPIPHNGCRPRKKRRV